MSDERPLMYSEFAGWFHLLTAPADYAEGAATYLRDLTEACAFEPRTMLELGSGGGNNASHLKAHFEITLTDLSPEMLALSRTLNPELEHIEADMRTLRLGRQFDVVFAHDAVSYLLDEESVRQAVRTAWEHLRPGGAALFAPDDLAEHWVEADHSGGHNGADGRAMRYLEWAHRRGIEAPLYFADYAYLLQDADGTVRVAKDRHTCAAHPRATWIAAFESCGFAVQVKELAHSDVEPGSTFHFVASKPSA
ncbi:MAG: class I SAM-dependent methyltransferase [Dehalococcoidia bacterium]